MVIGFVIFSGAIVSVIPQIVLIVTQRSSFGLNSFTLFVTSLGQFILVINIVCLRSADFIGVLQYPFSAAIGRLLTVFIQAALWLGTLPIVILNLVFFDKAARPARPTSKIHAESYFNRILTLLVVFMGLMIVAFFVVGTVLNGPGSLYVVRMGQFLGTVAGLMCVAQYLPQMVTTCKLRSSGSLSLVLLSIQAPGGLLNALFMAIGQKDHWTTYISILVASIQQFLLLGICLFFKARKKKPGRAMNTEDSSSTGKVSDPLLFDGMAYH
jgi:uncharacterized protein with PQ loop repeat